MTDNSGPSRPSLLVSMIDPCPVRLRVEPIQQSLRRHDAVFLRETLSLVLDTDESFVPCLLGDLNHPLEVDGCFVPALVEVVALRAQSSGEWDQRFHSLVPVVRAE